MNPEYANTYFQLPEMLKEFVIVTVHNPEGILHGQHANQGFDRALAAQLNQDGHSFWRVIGGSRDMTHAEPGYAVETDVVKGLDLGRRFRQEAIFYVNGDELHPVSCYTHAAYYPWGALERESLKCRAKTARKSPVYHLTGFWSCS